MTTFLRVSDLTVKAKDNFILDGISFELEKGKVLGLIGESGAGKSTLALAAIGYLKPGLEISSGSVVLDDNDLTIASDSALRQLRQSKVAYVAQSAAASFNPFFRLGYQVTELVILSGFIEKSDRYKVATDLFARLQLPSPKVFARKYPHQASGGQLQRAMIAMALLNDPDLIVFDEPTTALDVTTQLDVLSVIRQVVAEQGCAALYVSHDLAVVSQMCDSILVLRHGKMVEMNATRSIIDQPQDSYTRSLVAHRKVGDFLTDTPQADDAPLISAENITLGYGKVQIVPNASIALNENEILAIVGESGSGKTTVARAIAGLLEPWSGTIKLRGTTLQGNVDNRSQNHRQHIQFIHQLPDVALNPRQTIRTALMRPLQVFKGLDGAALNTRLNALMDEVELPRDLLGRYPGALSGGQKQRVCIARCLAAEPDLLICDEVTAALDPLVEDSILALLWRLKEEHRMAIIFITHNLGVTRRFAHSVTIMEHGKIVESGPTAQIFADPQQAYTCRLLASEPSTDAGWINARELSGATGPRKHRHDSL